MWAFTRLKYNKIRTIILFHVRRMDSLTHENNDRIMAMMTVYKLGLDFKFQYRNRQTHWSSAMGSWDVLKIN